MTLGTVKDMVSSVRGRLLNLARQTGEPFDEVLILYGLERFLFRLPQSAHKNDFILKGGLLLVGKMSYQESGIGDSSGGNKLL